MTESYGYILEGTGRPAAVRQGDLMETLHIPNSRIYRDALPPRPTRPRHMMLRREVLLSDMAAEGRLYVADILCLGAGEADVSWFLEGMQAKSVTVTIMNGLHTIQPGGDAAEIVDMFRRARLAAIRRRNRTNAHTA